VRAQNESGAIERLDQSEAVKTLSLACTELDRLRARFSS
jgi:hypothetical protein